LKNPLKTSRVANLHPGKCSVAQKTRGKLAFRERGETAGIAKLFANSKNEQKGESRRGIRHPDIIPFAGNKSFDDMILCRNRAKGGKFLPLQDKCNVLQLF